MKKLKSKLIGKRVELKFLKPTFKTANEVFSVVDKNRKHLAPWLPWEKETKKPEDTFKFLLSVDEDNKKGGKYTYGIYVEGEYVGQIGMVAYSKDKKSAEIGYWLSSEHSRKGYMTEALKVLEKEMFNVLGLNRIQIRCDEKNKASYGVAEKCKYKLEGKMREDAICGYTKKFRDTLVFSKLKKEFK